MQLGVACVSSSSVTSIIAKCDCLINIADAGGSVAFADPVSGCACVRARARVLACLRAFVLELVTYICRLSRLAWTYTVALACVRVTSVSVAIHPQQRLGDISLSRHMTGLSVAILKSDYVESRLGLAVAERILARLRALIH